MDNHGRWNCVSLLTENGDLRIKAESPALAITGFVDIPFEDIGIEP